MNIKIHWWLLVIFAFHSNAELSVQDAITMYAEDAIATVKLRLHKAAQKYEGQRQRRSIQMSFVNQSKFPAHGLEIDTIIPIQSIPTSHAVNIKPFQIDNSKYLAVVNNKGTDGGYRTMSQIYKFINGTFALIQEFPTTGCIDFVYAKLLMENYVIFVENVGTNWLGKESYSQSFKVYKHSKLGSSEYEFEYVSSIGMHGGTSVKSFIHGNNDYFVAANSYSNDGNKHNTKSILYLKTKFGFLMVQQFETQGAHDVEIFHIDGLIYIAFANNKDNEQRVDIYSTIYREKHPLGANGIIQFEYAQRILTHSAMDFEYFFFKNNHYLAVANENSQLITYNTNSKEKNVTVTNDYEIDSIIYWWSGKFFVEWQRIPTNGAVRWSSFHGPSGGMMLVVANSRSNAIIYTYDATRGLFRPTEVQGLRPSSLNVPDVRSVQPFNIANETYLAVANFKLSDGYNVFKLKFAYLPAKNNEPSLAKTITNSLLAVKEKIRKLKERLLKTKNLLNDVMTIDTNQTISGLMKFKRAHIERLVVGNLTYTNKTENNPIERVVYQAMILNRNLTEHEQRITELQEHLNDAVTINSSQNITGMKTFTNAVSFKNLSIKNMKVGLLNGVNITDLSKRVLSKTKDQNVTGKYVFLEDVKILSNLTVTGLVNGLRIPDNIMTTNTHQQVTGKKTFTENVTIFGNITTKNVTINGINVPNDLVLRSSNQRISGVKTFKSNVKFKKSVIVNGNVNGRNLSEFSRNVVTLSTDQVITGNKTFLNGFKISSNLHVSGLVDGVNLTHLYMDAAKQNMNETIKGTKRIFGSVNVKGDVETLSTTNGYRLQDDLMTTNTNQLIKSKKTFQSLSISGNLITNSTIDGVNLSKDVVTKNTEQMISGKKTFQKNVHLSAHMNVNGTVDGVNISKLNSSTVKINDDNNITAKKVFTGKVIVKNKISIEKKINNISLADLRKNILTINSNQTINAPIVFENLEILSDIILKGKLNGTLIPHDLIPLNKDTVINSNITFLNNVVFAKDLNFSKDGKLNGKILQSFANSVVLDGVNQSINGKITFKNNVSIENDFTVKGKINNFKIPDDFVTLNTVQNISGVKTFLKPVVIRGSLSTGIINVSSSINGVYISDLIKDAVYKDKNETIYGNLIFTGNVTSKGDIKVGQFVDGINITDLANNIVLLSKPQSISGLKIFANGIQFSSTLKSPGRINGVNLTELDTNSLKKSGNQLITGFKVFAGNVIVKGNLRSKTINGLNLEKFQNEIVTKNGNHTIFGSLTFLNNASFDNIIINGSINGIRTEDLMLTFGNQTIYGKKMFAKSLKIVKDLYVGKKINGINLTEFDSKVMKTNMDQNISAFLIFESGFHVNGSIEIAGTINKVDISELNLTAAHKGNEEIISGMKVFKNNVTIKGDVIFEKPINGINITDLLSDAMLKSEEQVICAEKVFTANDGVIVESSLIATNIKTSGFVNGINITDLDENVVKISNDQTLFGEYIFLNNVTFDRNIISNGHVNGINVTHDVLTKKGTQIIHGYKEFKNLIANRNINVTGEVDGVDISDFAKSRVTLSSNQTITGMKTFKSTIRIDGNLELSENATVNGIDISEELILRKNPSLIAGKKTFKSTITIKNDLNVNGTINGIDLKKLEKEIVLMNSNKTLFGKTTFMKNLKVYGNIEVQGYINGLKINAIYNNTRKLKKKSLEQLDILNGTLLQNCKKLKIMTGIAGAEIYLIAVEKIGQFSKEKVGQINSISIGNTIYVSIARLLGAPCGPAYILRCTLSLSCVTSQILKTRAIDLHFYNVSNEFYVFVGHWGSNTSGCLSYPEILKYDKSTGKFLSYFNVTRPFDRSIKQIKVDQGSNADLMAFIPPPLLTISLFISPIGSLDSLLSQKATMARTFQSNGTTFLVTTSVLLDISYVEIFMLNASTFKATRLQQIPTRQISSIDIGKVNNNIMLACAEGRNGGWRDIKVYTFLPTRNLFYFYQRMEIQAVSIRLSTIYAKHYLVFTSPENGFGLCPWRGVMGFQTCISVPDVGIQYIHTVVTNNGVFVIGTTVSQMVSYKAVFEGTIRRFNGTLNC